MGRQEWNDNFGVLEDLYGPWLDPPSIAACPGISRLRGFCQTETQQRFLDLWCLSQSTSLSADTEWTDSSGEKASSTVLTDRIGFPALIPEVWLNYMGPRKTADESLHLDENPSRVDSVMLAEGQKCVIEIDGKSHYADYREADRRWIPDERRYTRNLRIERSLRAQGWEIFRFSDFEIRTCPDDQFDRLVSHLPGVAFN